MVRFHRPRNRCLLALAALGIATMLGGCVAYPDYPGYGYGYGSDYGYGPGPYYGGYPDGYVAIGGGWGDHGGDRHDGDWHGGDRHGHDWH